MSLEFVAREKALGIGCALDNQKSYYDSLTSFGVAAPIGEFKSTRWQINSELVHDLITSAELRKSLVEKGAGLIDLRGVNRIVDEIISLN
jgi:spore coat polysaccharide biosynthesis predicted glycosyltransferase SpsG